jgi:hypothetical protein
MFYLENNTTFSGSDIKVYAYRNVSDFKNFTDKDKARERNEKPLEDETIGDIEKQIGESLENIASAQPIFEPRNNIEVGGEKFADMSEKATQETLNFHAAPKIEELPQEYEVITTTQYGKDSATVGKIFSSEAEAENYIQSSQANIQEAKQLTIDTLVQAGIPQSEAESQAEETFSGFEISSEVEELPKYATVSFKGETRTIPVEQAEDLADAYVPPIVTSAPAKVDYTAVQTNKVNPNFIDIVKTGPDKKALEFIRKNQLAKANKNRNFKVDSKGNPGEVKPIIELGSLYSITYSSFREKHAVRTLGRVSAKDYTKGQRTIAGSMSFAVFQSHELMDFLRKGQPNENNIVILDQLPKFNLMLVMINEYGGASILHLFGVTISTESQQTSVEDLALMNNVTFYAEDVITIEDIGNIFETSVSMLHPTVIAGQTLRFYKKNEFTTLSGLLEANLDTIGNEPKKTGKINRLLNRSRGLF